MKRLINLFKRKPKRDLRLKDFLKMEFPEKLNKPRPTHLTGLKKHLNTKFEVDLINTSRSIFHIAITKVR